MPTISQLPTATVVTSSDAVPVSQGGVARSATLGALLASTQPAIIVNTGVLLGRTSLGPGGPEGVAVGSGLVLNASTLQTSMPNYATLPVATSLPTAASVIVTDSGNNPQLLQVAHLRDLFSAGSNVSIGTTGVISSSTGSPGTSYNIAALPPTTAAAAQDMVGISQSGTSHAIAYSNLINGQTIDTAQPATSVSDGDNFWVAQGSSTMVAQTFNAVWPWIQTKLVSFKTPVVEISTNTTIDGTVHNGRVLLCSQPVVLTPLAINMGSGFHCDIINISAGTVSFAGTVVTSSGSSILASGQAATLWCLTYSSGTLLYAVVGNGRATSSVPGQVTSFTSSANTLNSVSLTWSGPVSGAAATGYVIQYRVSGSLSWTAVGSSITALTYTVAGLLAGTSYDFCAFATNASGSGLASTVITVATASASSAPGVVGGLTSSNPTPTSLQLSWQAPTVGTPAVSYTLQYRVTGTGTWTGSVSGISGTTQGVTGLIAATSYDFSVFAINAAGTGPISAVLAASTAVQTGAVTSIVWNVAPTGSYAHGSGVIGVNVHVTPASAAVQFGMSTSATTPPSSWTAGTNVNTDLWGAYVSTPATAGTWYAWASGTDGSAPTRYATAFTVT